MVTLQGFPSELRPGGVTSPKHTWLWRFLSAENDSTTALQNFFQEARLELEQFIREGSLTPSDSVFYRQLLDETNRISTKLIADGSKWTSSVIPDAYSAGWRVNSSVVVPQAALEALSRDTLGLIVGASADIRTSIRQSIAQGILQGLSASDIRTRILASGLSNIPHWPSVEYRAGVIARTETMKAFNAGVLSGIESTGAAFVRWIISPDEAVCPICGPRGGRVFRIADFPGADPYPTATPLPKIPAHPRCRCSIRAEYRDPDGKVIRPGTAPVEPTLPPDAMGGRLPPVVPPAVGDFPNALGQLATYSADDVADWMLMRRLSSINASLPRESLELLFQAGGGSIARFEALQAQLGVQFWRGLGALDADQIGMIAALKGTKGNLAFSNFLQLRYGITWGKPLGWVPELRAATIQALERLRAINPSYVVDSEYLRFLGIRPPNAGRFGGNVIARAFPTGHVEGNMRSWAQFIRRGLRSGSDSAAEEVILHEFLHTVHFRYGLYDGSLQTSRWNFKAVEKIGREWHDDYIAIRRETTGLVAPDNLEALRERARHYRELSDGFPSYARQAEQIEKAVAQIEAGSAELFPTDYARQSYAEDFAESGMLYFLNPARLKRFSPRRYAFFRDRVFGGAEA